MARTFTVDTAVIGGGIAGLAAAFELQRRGGQAVVFEASQQPGGLLAPICINGFTFDTAVHLSFAKEPEVREIFDRTKYLTHNPVSLCHDAKSGLWLKHPIQNNLFPLTLNEKVELLTGLVQAPAGEITNYRDWLVQQYGEPIAARWPLVYSEKYWTVPAERLGTAWVGQRMRRADLKEVMAGALSSETPNHYYVSEMRYPEKGGYYAFIEPLVDAVELQLGRRASEVRSKERRVRFADGSEAVYRNLISTMPLPNLVEIMNDVPDNIRADAASLFATSIDLISVGFRRPAVSPSLWFYIYDQDIWAARAYSPDKKSAKNVPEGCSALQFEIYSSRERPQTHTPEELKLNTVQGLAKMGLAEPEDIIFVEHHHVPFANVVFDLGMEARRDRVRGWVRAQDVILAGRFGEWDYLWSNQSMMSGIRAARDVSDLTAERHSRSA
jgi:protoporphyrinogen oxidase